MTDSVGPLAGVRVLDVSQVIAGPYGTSLLTHSGAEVIKIEPLGGEIARGLASGFLGWNRGKRAMALNLQAEAGVEVFYRLAKWADVFVENFRPGVTNRLKIDYPALSALNPEIIYVSASAFGQTGPYSHRPGFDPLLQAMTGVERSQGGRHNPPVFLRIAITDNVTAMTHAAAITMALYHRERTGRGQRIEVSLLQSGILVNGDAFTRYPGRPARLLPDAGQHGLGPLDRMYAASDGWIFIYVGGSDERWGRLAPVVGIGPADARFSTAAAREQNGDDLARLLESAFSSRSADEWLETLEDAGVPAAPVIEGYGSRLFEDVQPIINGYIISGEHAERGHMEQPGNYIRYSLTPTSQEGRPAPLLGQHTDEILAQFGYSTADIGRLRDEGVVA